MDLGFLWAERDYIQTGAYCQQALALARGMDDPITLAHTLNRLGNWQVNVEQPLEALRSHQEALTLFQQAHDVQGIAQTYDLLGMANTLGGICCKHPPITSKPSPFSGNSTTVKG
jgi:hypothetical protein